MPRHRSPAPQSSWTPAREDRARLNQAATDGAGPHNADRGGASGFRIPTRYKSSQPKPRAGRDQAHTRSRRPTTRRREKVAAPPPHQSWRKLLRILDWLGCFSFLSALASIWRMRSRVTENRWPTSSSVWSVFIPMPKRMRNTRSSRGVTEASTRVVVSRWNGLLTLLGVLVFGNAGVFVC
jgi:hypothetical protein